MKKIFTVLLAFALGSFGFFAQAQEQNNLPQQADSVRHERPDGRRPGGRRHHEHQKLTKEQIAHQMTDRMDRLLTLSDKQYQKIYKINLKEVKEREADSLFLSRGGMRNGGFGPGPGGPRPGGQMGQRPERPEFKQLSEQQREQLREQREKARVKKDKQLRKILTDEQYGKWVKAEQERLVKMQQMHKARQQRGHRPNPGQQQQQQQ